MLQRIFNRRSSDVSDSFVVSLPSCIPGLHFTAEFNLVWTPLVPPQRQCNPAEAARVAVGEEATQVSRTMSVTRIATAECHINAQLGRLGDCARGEVRIKKASVHLSVPAEIARLAADHEHKLREEKLADDIQQRQLDRLSRFRETVLAEPAAAMAYWFMNNPDQLDNTTYDKIENLTKRVMSYDPRARSLQIAELLDKFISNLTFEDKRALITILTAVMSGFGHRDDAYRIAAIIDPAGENSNLNE
jgi:hypothetical protein